MTRDDAIRYLQEKVGEDEPVFVLRAQDRCAQGAVRDWAKRATGIGAPEKKVESATDCAFSMGTWGQTHETKVPD